MSLARTALLKISDSQWMREHGVKAPFVRRAVSTFMPGETAADMLTAAAAQAARASARCSRGWARTSSTWTRRSG